MLSRITLNGKAVMPSWKLTLPCTKAEAEAVEATDVFAAWDTPPVLLASEPDEDKPDEWELLAYVDEAPNAALIVAFERLAPSAADTVPRIEQLADQDWVTLSQQGLEPITAGRFYVRTPHYPAMAGKVEFVIDAGLAFGTGQHATTSGCLWALEALASKKFHNILDLGTGTGLLAFAALSLWPKARGTASDIDPISIEVSTGNARINAVPLGIGEGALKLVVADGMASPDLADRAPYDLIIANILAQPLIDMAANIVGGLAEGGTLILSGLLVTQAPSVIAAYRAQGMRLSQDSHHGDWGVLVLVRTAGLEPAFP